MPRSSTLSGAAGLVLCLFLVPTALCAPGDAARPGPLVLGAEDLRIEQRGDAGYHLYIRARKGLGSVLLTESTKDPERKADSYAYRAVERNAINGDEPRVLDGKRIPSANGQHFLIDSSPEPDSALGSAYHIFIPWVVVWGYSWSRSGREFIHDGTFINIRAFERPYADYSGPFSDNPYVVRVTQSASSRRAATIGGTGSPTASAPSAPAADPASAPVAKVAPAAPSAPAAETASKAPAVASVASPASPAPVSKMPAADPASAPVAKVAPATPSAPAAETASKAPAVAKTKYADPTPPPRGDFMPETVAAFSDIVGPSGGILTYAATGRDIPGAIDAILARHKGESIDIVLCVDTTDTMADGIEAMKAALPGLLFARTGDFPSYRLGLVAFKDYFEEYLYRRFDFTRDLAAFSRYLDALRPGGGRDIPEAVFEALYAALDEFSWSAPKRVVILVGDAPPHPLPRGSIDGASVEEAAAAAGAELDAVVGPI